MLLLSSFALPYVQVGPSIEVLGDIATKNGLALSLLERLHTKYKAESNKGCSVPLVFLYTNFRCHPDILSLVGTLFYTSTTLLKLPDNKELYSQPYREESACFVFICSEIDDRVLQVKQTTNEPEANIILKEIMTITNYQNWPEEYGKCDLNKISVISQSRKQV